MQPGRVVPTGHGAHAGPDTPTGHGAPYAPGPAKGAGAQYEPAVHPGPDVPSARDASYGSEPFMGSGTQYGRGPHAGAGAPHEFDGRPERNRLSPFAPVGVDFVPVNPSLATVRLITASITLAPFLLGAVALVVLFGHWPLWMVLGLVVALTVWLWWLIPRQVRAMGYAEQDEDLLIRKGILFRSLVVVPYGRMQQIDVEAGPLDRRFGIASVKLSTASASTDAKIAGLPADEAARLREALTSRGEARLAGL